jgi:hypothetical protein
MKLTASKHSKEGESTVKKHAVISCALLLAVFPGVLTPQIASNASTVAEKPAQETYNHALFLGLVRTINTAEATEISKYGSPSVTNVEQSGNAGGFSKETRVSLVPSPGFSVRRANG